MWLNMDFTVYYVINRLISTKIGEGSLFHSNLDKKKIKNQNCLFHSNSWQIENILVIVCENDKDSLLSVVVYA